MCGLRPCQLMKCCLDADFGRNFERNFYRYASLRDRRKCTTQENAFDHKI